jgi:hypothetical protein
MPFSVLSFHVDSVGLELGLLDPNLSTTTILAGTGVALYGLRKLDVISDMLSYLLGILVVCVVLVIHPSFTETAASEYAEQTLSLMMELLDAFIELVKSWGGLEVSAVLGGDVY